MYINNFIHECRETDFSVRLYKETYTLQDIQNYKSNALIDKVLRAGKGARCIEHKWPILHEIELNSAYWGPSAEQEDAFQEEESTLYDNEYALSRKKSRINGSSRYHIHRTFTTC